MAGLTRRLTGSLTQAATSRPGAFALRAVGVRSLVCVGDSHLRPMFAVRRQRLLPRTVLEVVAVSGASATGIAHAGSATQALRHFRMVTARLRPDSTVLVSLGEVDVGFLVYLRALQAGGTPREHAEAALTRYTRFLTEEVLARGARPLVLSAVPPTVADYATWNDRENKRRLLTTSREERAAMTAWWNDALGAWCGAHGAGWLDQTAAIVVPGTMQVRPEWLHPDGEDQHVHPQKQAELYAELLRAQGFR